MCTSSLALLLAADNQTPLPHSFLQPPGAFHTLYPPNGTSSAQQTRPATQGAGSSSSVQSKKTASLIERYHLEDRVQKGETVEEEKVGGKATWEDSPEKREASLKERKAQMILAARQCVLLTPHSECAVDRPISLSDAFWPPSKRSLSMQAHLLHPFRPNRCVAESRPLAAV